MKILSPVNSKDLPFSRPEMIVSLAFINSSIKFKVIFVLRKLSVRFVQAIFSDSFCAEPKIFRKLRRIRKNKLPLSFAKTYRVRRTKFEFWHTARTIGRQPKGLEKIIQEKINEKAIIQII